MDEGWELTTEEMLDTFIAHDPAREIEDFKFQGLYVTDLTPDYGWVNVVVPGRLLANFIQIEAQNLEVAATSQKLLQFRCIRRFVDRTRLVMIYRY